MRFKAILMGNDLARNDRPSLGPSKCQGRGCRSLVRPQLSEDHLSGLSMAKFKTAKGPHVEVWYMFGDGAHAVQCVHRGSRDQQVVVIGIFEETVATRLCLITWQNSVRGSKARTLLYSCTYGNKAIFNPILSAVRTQLGP